MDGELSPLTQPPKHSLLLRLLPRKFLQDFRHCCVSLYTVLCFIITPDTVHLRGVGKRQLRWEKEKKVVPLVEQSQEILAWLGKLSYQ